MISIIGFLVALCPLVVFHELGHFLFAKLFNVKAEIFSVGFGPKIWTRVWGETEFRLSAIPLGGYVKLLGEDGDKPLSPEEAARSLSRAKRLHRFLIFFGGPLFNFILTVLIYMVIMAYGEPQIANQVGRVIENSPAAHAGLKSGDLIVSVDGQPITKYEELIDKVSEKPDSKVQLKVDRSGKAIEISVNTKSQDGFSAYGESKSVGDIDGIFPMGRANVIGVSNPESVAAKAGAKTGDKVSGIQIADSPPIEVKNWEFLEDQIAALAAGTKVTFFVEREGSSEKINIPYTKDAKRRFSDVMGLYSSELFVEKAIEDSPALRAGLKKGDRLIGINDFVVPSFFDLRTSIQKAGEKDGKFTLVWERDGKVLKEGIVPTAKEVKDPLLRKSTQYTIGVAPMLVWDQPKEIIERVTHPVHLVWGATLRMVDLTVKNFVSIGKMVKGDVSVKTLGGPILIGKIAGDSLSRGLVAFLTTMAILSVGLGVLNLLPVPVLDGGHMLLLILEAIRGQPLSMKQMEFVQKVGLSLILLLMVVVFHNDLKRLTLPFLE